MRTHVHRLDGDVPGARAAVVLEQRLPVCERVLAAVASIVAQAVSARNGWKDLGAVRADQEAAFGVFTGWAGGKQCLLARYGYE